MTTASSGITGLLQSIGQYRKKYYQNQLLKGALISVALLLALFLAINALEYFGRFPSVVRGGLLFGYVAAFCMTLYYWVLKPLIHLSGLKKPLSDEAAARQIGQHFPEVGDKLINTLQLTRLPASDLIEASVRQKSSQLLIVRFSDAITFRENNKYLKYTAYPIAAVAMILLFNPSFFTTSSERILHFNTHYNDAPFTFQLENESMKAFRNENFTVKLNLEGNALPQAVYLVLNGTRFKLNTDGPRSHSYTFKNLQRDLAFHFDAAGYQSSTFRIQVIERPSLLSFDVNLHYPAYLRKPAESLNNAGNLTVPEGTRIEWQFKTAATRGLGVRFDTDSVRHEAKSARNGQYTLAQTVRKSSPYQLLLHNDDLPEGEALNYYVNVIPDQHPELSMENFQDTTLYNYLVAGGSISDDYGFTRLSLFYTVYRDGDTDDSKKTPEHLEIPFNKLVNTQSFYFQWYLDSLQLNPGDRIEYYAQVWDNDGVNGPKSTRSRPLQFEIPGKSQIEAEIDRSVQETQEQIEKTLNKAKSLEKDLENLENRLKTNNELDFQERKQAEDILKKREELLQEIQTLQEKNSISNDKSRQFDQQSESVRKKMDELQKLMDDLLNEENTSLYQELQKLLEQKQSERMAKLLERLRNKERNTEKELERTLNLFKKLQLEQKMEQTSKNLEELAGKQEELAEETSEPRNEKDPAGKEGTKEDPENKDAEKDTDTENNDGSNQQDHEKNESLIEKQDAIKTEFERIREELEKLEQLGEEIQQPVDTQQEEQNNAAEQMKNSKSELSQRQNQKAAQSQKKAAQSMRNMSQQMQQNMQDSQTMQLQEDMDALRDILENLLTLSFDQEQLMKDFRGVSLSDPRFVALGQQQLKLQDDAKIVEDSLYALANRVLQIQSFITRELNDMKFHMDESVKSIKDRQLAQVTSRQQFAMTSMNNLALMLSDIFRQMQQAMAMAMMMPGASGKEPQSGQSPGEMQQQLNSQMREMGKGSQPGEGRGGNRSEQLARMAAEQAAIRELLQKLLDDQKGTAFGQQYGKELQEMMEQMDKSETEIVNKRVSQELIKRNEELVTRLLESEKALREQDEDDKRKGETARQIQRQPPAAFEEYIKSKEQQTELLRTVPANFAPFYKRETDAYFQKYQGTSR